MRKIKREFRHVEYDPIIVKVWDNDDKYHVYHFVNSSPVWAIKRALASNKPWWNLLPSHRQELYTIVGARRWQATNDYVAGQMMVLSNRPEIMED